MTRRVRVTIGRMTVDGGTIADPAAFRAEVERAVSLSLAAPEAIAGLTGRNLASAGAVRVKAAGDAHAVAGAIAAAIGGGRAK